MVLSLTDNEYRMLQILASKGLDCMKTKLGNYSYTDVPTCFRNRCSEEMKKYEEFANRLLCNINCGKYPVQEASVSPTAIVRATEISR